MKPTSRSNSLQWKLPLLVGAILLLIIGGLSIASYLAVRQTTILAGTSRLQAVTQQLAGAIRTSSAVSVAGARETASAPVLHQYLRNPDPRLRREVLDALAFTGPNTVQMLAVELRDTRGRRVITWGPGAARMEQVDDADVRRVIARQDSASVGAYRSIGDTVVYPIYARIKAGNDFLGYVVQWRRQFSTAQARQVVVDLIGAEAELFLGDTTQGYWTDLIARTSSPPETLPLGTDIARPAVVRYERPGKGTRFAAAARARGTPWVALVEFPTRVVLQPAGHFLERLLGVVAGVSLLALLAVWILSRWLTVPLRELATVADAVASGDRSRRVTFERTDELGRLAVAFNRLAGGVQETHRVAEERFRLLVETVADYAIFVLDRAGVVASWNNGAQRLKGYSADEIIGRHFSSFYPEEDIRAGKPDRELREATANGRVEDEGWRVRKDGTRFWANVVITALRDDTGELVGFAKVTRDMTERREAEEALRHRTRELDAALHQLREAQESLVRREKLAILGQLASGVGHELRNPLGVMTNAIFYLEAVLRDPPANVREYLGILRGQVELSEKIVSDLLDFARVKPPQRQPVTLREVVDRQLERVGRMDDVKVSVEMPGNLPPALADQVQVGQVVLNLLTNAVQAMGEGGNLTVRGSANGDGKVYLEVADEGGGIAPENMDKIFEPLFTTKARGMGLGLAVSRALAIANGGDILVRSTQGHGATFTLILPIADLGKAA